MVPTSGIKAVCTQSPNQQRLCSLVLAAYGTVVIKGVGVDVVVGVSVSVTVGVAVEEAIVCVAVELGSGVSVGD